MNHEEHKPSKDLIHARIHFAETTTDAPGELPYHYHDSFEIFRSLNESLRYRVNGAVYEVSRGDLLVLNQFDIHQSLARPQSRYRRQLTLFYPELVASWSVAGYDLLRCFERRPSAFSHLIRLSRSDQRRFQELFSQGLESEALPEPEREMVRRLLIAQMLVVVNRGTQLEPHSRDEAPPSADQAARLDAVIRYVEEHLTEPLSLAGIAAQFGTTPNGLNRLCRRAGRITLHQYILRRRVEQARLELSRGMTVTEAAYAAGFGNLSHFIRIFRQKTGLSPKEFQRSILERVTTG
ncbi:MAG: helix-turn-helix domain-containing protein [Spirochaetales bacterium]